MKTQTSPNPIPFEKLPRDYAGLCGKVWLPRPIHDETEYQAALLALEPFWGREDDLNDDQSDWFRLATSLAGEFEDSKGPNPKRLPLTRRLAGLVDEHGLTAADFARLLDLEPSMGSKILKGSRQLTVQHVQKLSKHFALPADYFLEG